MHSEQGQGDEDGEMADNGSLWMSMACSVPSPSWPSNGRVSVWVAPLHTRPHSDHLLGTGVEKGQQLDRGLQRVDGFPVGSQIHRRAKLCHELVEWQAPQVFQDHGGF